MKKTLIALSCLSLFACSESEQASSLPPSEVQVTDAVEVSIDTAQKTIKPQEKAQPVETLPETNPEPVIAAGAQAKPAATPVSEVQTTDNKELVADLGETYDKVKEKAKYHYNNTTMSDVGDSVVETSKSLYEGAKNSDVVKSTGEAAEDVVDSSKKMYEDAKNSETAKKAGEWTNQLLDQSKDALEYLKKKTDDLNQGDGGKAFDPNNGQEI